MITLELVFVTDTDKKVVDNLVDDFLELPESKKNYGHLRSISETLGGGYITTKNEKNESNKYISMKIEIYSMEYLDAFKDSLKAMDIYIHEKLNIPYVGGVRIW